MPFAFEVGGAWGTEAEDFLHEAVKVAEHCRNGVGDLSHWSAMNWGDIGGSALALRSPGAWHAALSGQPRVGGSGVVPRGAAPSNGTLAAADPLTGGSGRGRCSLKTRPIDHKIGLCSHGWVVGALLPFPIAVNMYVIIVN